MSNPADVEVLLATYNGARFLREQLDSIFGQQYENLHVLARDDGSSDETVEILQQYASRFPGRLRLLPTGKPSGSAKSNFLLLMRASTASYICFADQDDVWLPDKLLRTKQAMEQLEKRRGLYLPLLVFTELQVVNDKLEKMYGSFWKHMHIDPEAIRDFPRLMVQSVVTGCTAMINRPLLELALRMPEEAAMHDRWVGLVASGLGRSGVVRAPTVLYRQHDRNVVGTGRTLPGTGVAQARRPLLERVRRPQVAAEHVANWDVSQRQAKAFLAAYHRELPAKKRAVLTAFLRCQGSRSRFVRLATFVSRGFFYPGLKANVAMFLYLSRQGSRVTTKVPPPSPDSL